MRASLLLLLVLAVPALAQPVPPTVPDRTGPHRQSGPRIGVTYLSPGVVERINAATSEGGVGDRIDPSFPVTTQIGWQFEFQTFQTPSGATGLAEIVPLLGGLERGIIAPSLTVLTGLRTSSGVEFAFGPNVSVIPQEPETPRGPSGEAQPLDAAVRLGLAIAAGANTRFDGVSVPINAALVMGTGGARVSLLFGLNTSSARY